MARQTSRTKKPTLKTISDLTGFAISTVSLSLRGSVLLKDATRQTILETARRVGYVPDSAGVRLRTGRTGAMVLVLDTSRSSEEQVSHLLQGMGAAAAVAGYRVMVLDEQAFEDPMAQLRQIALDRLADGIVLVKTEQEDARVRWLNEAGIPFVTYGRTEAATAHAFHDFHSEKAGTQAARRLIELGRSSLCCVVDGQPTYTNLALIRAFERTANKTGKRTRTLRGPGRLDMIETRKLADALLRDLDPPDGIYCDGEREGLVLLKALEERGLSRGGDFDLIIRGASQMLRALAPELDNIHENLVDAGQELVRLLIRRIAGEAAEDLQTLSEPFMSWKADEGGATRAS